MAEQIPTPAVELRLEPTFLKDVAEMATLAEEAIRKLRTEPHGDKFKFADLQSNLSYLFPQQVDSVEYLGRLEKVVRVYLENTAISGLGSGADLRNGNAINANTSHFPWTVAEWMKSVYTPRKDEIDARVEALAQEISRDTTQKIRDAVFELGLNSNNQDRLYAVVGKPALTLEELTGKMSELKTRLYETELSHPEDLAKLYESCFNAEANKRGWLDLENAQLIEVLEKENALDLFQKYNPEREIKLPEVKAEETGKPKRKGKLARIMDIIRTPAQAASADGRTSALIAGTPKQYHFISAGNYFVALEQLRTDSAADQNSLQPTITIGGRTDIRPHTVKELMQFRLEDYNTLTNPNGTLRTEEERKRLLNQWFFTCSGIAYSTNGNFKLSREASQLITMNSIPTANYLPVDYSALNTNNNWQEFARSQSGVKYNAGLTEEEAVAHPMWQFLAEGDTTLIRETHQLNCSLYNRSTAMYAWLLDIPEQVQLRALALYYYYDFSSLDGDYGLYSSSFLRVARRSS